MNLRPYQQKAIDDLLEWFEQNPTGNPIVAACVGAGKSVMIAHLCHLAARGYDFRSRVLMLVPSKELLEQNYAKLVQVAPDLRIGIVSASAGRKDPAFDKDVVVATVGSVRKNPGNLGRLDLIMVDECHLVARKETGQYRKLIADCQAFNPALRVIGWTGTPYRGDGIWLTAGEERLFSDIAARVTMDDLLAQGFLAPLTPIGTSVQVSGDDVRTSGGDYVVAALAAKLDQDELTRKIAADIVEIGRERKRWLVFCVTVAHASHMLDELKAHGIAAAMVTGETPKGEREHIIKAFRAGHFQCLVNVAVLTTGFDVPDVDLLALVRNTKSPVLYTQIAGRGMRTADGKTDCLWLDFTDTTMQLGPVNEIRGRNEPKKRADDEERGAPFRICDECGSENPASAVTCKSCGFEFPPPERKIYGAANGASVLSKSSFGYTTHTVNRVSYRAHVGKAGVPIMRVDYWGGMRVIASEWVCLEHEGFARKKAERWWSERWGGKFSLPVPGSVDQALKMTDFLKTPTTITTKTDGKYAEVVRALFDEIAA